MDCLDSFSPSTLAVIVWIVVSIVGRLARRRPQAPSPQRRQRARRSQANSQPPASNSRVGSRLARVERRPTPPQRQERGQAELQEIERRVLTALGIEVPDPETLEASPDAMENEPFETSSEMPIEGEGQSAEATVEDTAVESVSDDAPNLPLWRPAPVRSNAVLPVRRGSSDQGMVLRDALVLATLLEPGSRPCRVGRRLQRPTFGSRLVHRASPCAKILGRSRSNAPVSDLGTSTKT